MSEGEENEEDELLEKENRERVHVTMVLVAGIISGVVSYLTFGLSSLVSILPAVALSVVVLGVFAAVFSTPSKKKVAFTVVLTIATWFVTGTFILQLL